MKRLGKSEHLLDLIQHPAFTVIHGKISHVNQAARAMHIMEETAIQTLLPENLEAYLNFQGECLYLTVQIFEISCGASITRNGKTDIFILDDPEGNDQLAALELAGNQLRIPLTNLFALLDTHFTGDNLKDIEMIRHVSQLRRNLTSIQRSAQNMSECLNWAKKAVTKTAGDLNQVFKETMEKASSLLSQKDIFIRYTYPQQPVITMFNEEMVRRALYNMISNAAKYSVLDPLIEADLSVDGDKAVISVQSPCCEEEQNLFFNAFANYQRKPSLEDGRLGIGLGMTYIRSAATGHNGTCLIDRPEGKKVRVTITMQLQQPAPSTKLRNHMSKLSNYAGGVDLALLELADILPSHCYDQ